MKLAELAELSSGGRSLKLAELAELSSGLDLAAFSSKYPHPALIFLMGGPVDDAPKSARPVDETAEFKTTRRLAVGLRGLPLLDPDAPVAFLVKRSTWTPFDDVITVGRATVQDVCLAQPSVSKFHACITRFPNNGWKITDERAANGTFVDQKQLPPGGSIALHDGARLGFGPEVDALFFGVEGLRELLVKFRAGA